MIAITVAIHSSALSFPRDYPIIYPLPLRFTATMSSHIVRARLGRPGSSVIQIHSLRETQSIVFATSKGRTTNRLISSSASSTSHAVSTFQPANRLVGRTCMVTGASSGIGFAIAERFLQEGASSIILVGRSEERLQAAAAKLYASASASYSSNGVSHESSASIPEKIRPLVGDVARAGSWARELEREMVCQNQLLNALSMEQFSPFKQADVDILVNAAGISISSILAKSELEDISNILRTNLEGAMLTSRALMRAAVRNCVRNRKEPMTERYPPSKCIINISSLLALKAGTGAVPYAASKAGLLGLTRSMAVEASASLRHVTIRSNAIVPGYIDTPMISGMSGAE